MVIFSVSIKKMMRIAADSAYRIAAGILPTILCINTGCSKAELCNRVNYRVGRLVDGQKRCNYQHIRIEIVGIISCLESVNVDHTVLVSLRIGLVSKNKLAVVIVNHSGIFNIGIELIKRGYDINIKTHRCLHLHLLQSTLLFGEGPFRTAISVYAQIDINSGDQLHGANKILDIDHAVKIGVKCDKRIV